MKSHSFVLLLCFSLSATAADKPTPVSIETLVANTLAGNPELQYYEAEILAAKAGRREAGKLGNPELNVDFGRMRVVNGSSDTNDLTRSIGVGYAVTLAQPIEWPGRLGLRKAIANRDITLAELGLARFRSFLASRVRALAYALAMQQQDAAAAGEVAERFAAVRAVLVQRDPAGAAPLLEARIIEAATVGVQRRAGETAVLMQKTLLELNYLMGRRADTPLIVKRADFALTSLPPLGVLLAQSAQHNYDLRVKRVELEQQGLKVDLAKNERHPTFTVGPVIQDQLPGGRQTLIGINVSMTARKLLLRVPGRVGLGRGAGTGCEGVWQALAGLHDDGAADTVGPGDGFVVCREKGAAERFDVLFNPAQPGGARDVPKVNVAINDGRRLVGTGQCDEAEPAEDVCADAAHAMNSLMGPV